jgi:hypothetical protein
MLLVLCFEIMDNNICVNRIRVSLLNNGNLLISKGKQPYFLVIINIPRDDLQGFIKPEYFGGL